MAGKKQLPPSFLKNIQKMKQGKITPKKTGK